MSQTDNPAPGAVINSAMQGAAGDSGELGSRCGLKRVKAGAAPATVEARGRDKDHWVEEPGKVSRPGSKRPLPKPGNQPCTKRRAAVGGNVATEARVRPLRSLCRMLPAVSQTSPMRGGMG